MYVQAYFYLPQDWQMLYNCMSYFACNDLLSHLLHIHIEYEKLWLYIPVQCTCCRYYLAVSVLCDWMFTGLYCYNLHVLQLLDLCNFWCCNCCVAISWSYLQSGLLIVSIYFLKCNSYKWLSNQELLPNTPISSTDGLIW